MSIDTLPKPLEVKTDSGDHDRFTHIVRGKGNKQPQDLIAEAKLYGTTVTALCGKTWIPNKNPENYPLCRECAQLAFKIPKGR